VAIDKLDKIGQEGVKKELVKLGLDENSVNSIFSCLNITIDECSDAICESCGDQSIENVRLNYPQNDLANIILKINCLKDRFKKFQCLKGLEGLEEVRNTVDFLNNLNLSNKLILSLTLARGLSYYTGCILEVTADDVQMGSIGGGGMVSLD